MTRTMTVVTVVRVLCVCRRMISTTQGQQVIQTANGQQIIVQVRLNGVKRVFFFFYFFENILKPQFFGKIDWSMNSGRQRAGDS